MIELDDIVYVTWRPWPRPAGDGRSGRSGRAFATPYQRRVKRLEERQMAAGSAAPAGDGLGLQALVEITLEDT